MTEGPLYGLNRKPRFSTNHLALYLCTTGAPARTGIIRDAKFPRRLPTVAYAQAKPPMAQFLTSADPSHLDTALARFAAKAARETGYRKDEALRCHAAIEAFKETFKKAKAKKFTFSSGPADTFLKLAGVHISVRLDAHIVQTAGDASNSGGCILFMAAGEAARRRIEDRRKYVAATIHWALETGQMEPLPKLCMSFDVFGGVIEKAPTSFERLRNSMRHSCDEVANRWDKVEPPPGYDGPDWR